MKRTVLGLVALAIMCACANMTPKQREAAAVEGYTKALVWLKEARDAGKIGDEKWTGIVQPAVAAAREARRAVKQAREQGASMTSIAFLLDTFVAAAHAVVALQEEESNGPQ